MGSSVEVSVQPDSFPTLVSPYTCSALPSQLSTAAMARAELLKTRPTQPGFHRSARIPFTAAVIARLRMASACSVIGPFQQAKGCLLVEVIMDVSSCRWAAHLVCGDGYKAADATVHAAGL